MRPTIVPTLILLLAAAGACSRHDQSEARRDAHIAVADAKVGVQKLASSADVAKAKAEVRKTADQAKREIHKTAEQAKAAVRHTAHEAKHKADS